MKNKKIEYKLAKVKDIDSILVIMESYYNYDKLEFNKEIARNRLREFLKSPELGKIWLIIINKVIEGYIVITNGFGFEHGRNITIDEFYINTKFRGYGIGNKTIKHIEKEMRKIGISSIHLEVERDNSSAQQFWGELGYKKFDRYPMVRVIKKT